MPIAWHGDRNVGTARFGRRSHLVKQTPSTQFRVCRRAAGLAFVLIALAGCAAPEPTGPTSLIVLQSPRTGRIVPCGPPPGTHSANPASEAERCARSYERLGYHRLPIETNEGS